MKGVTEGTMRQIRALTVEIYLRTFHFFTFLGAGCWEESGGGGPSIVSFDGAAVVKGVVFSHPKKLSRKRLLGSETIHTLHPLSLPNKLQFLQGSA